MGSFNYGSLQLQLLGNYFLRATTRSTKRVLAIVEAFVRPSYCSIVSKRRKLGSWDLQCEPFLFFS